MLLLCNNYAFVFDYLFARALVCVVYTFNKITPPSPIKTGVERFLASMNWNCCGSYRRECVAHWTKNFATDEVVYTGPIIQNFLSFIDHMSCNADTYVSLGGSNGCADQLTNWDGTQKLGLGASPKKKSQGQSR